MHRPKLLVRTRAKVMSLNNDISETSSPICIPAALDDRGLLSTTFRVYTRLARRANGFKGECFESIPHMAEGCRLTVPTVKAAIKLLLELKMIQFNGTHPSKQTKRFSLLPPENWLPIPGGQNDYSSSGFTPQGGKTTTGRGGKTTTPKGVPLRKTKREQKLSFYERQDLQAEKAKLNDDQVFEKNPEKKAAMIARFKEIQALLSP